MNRKELALRTTFIVSMGMAGATSALAVEKSSLWSSVENNNSPVVRDIGQAEQIAPDIQPTATRLPIKLETELLNGKILEKAYRNIVTVMVSPKPGVAPDAPTESCSGFITRNNDGQPHVVTTRHCVPSVYKSLDDDIIKPAEVNGKSIWDINAIGTGANANIYTSRGYLSFDTKFNFDGSIIGHDVIVIPIKDNGAPEGLKISKFPLTFGEPLFRVGLDNEGNFDSYGVQYVAHNDAYEFDTIFNGKQEYACRPGNSGSAMINSSGEVVGILTKGGEFNNISAAIVNYFNLDNSALGSTITVCTLEKGILADTLINLKY